MVGEVLWEEFGKVVWRCEVVVCVGVGGEVVCVEWSGVVGVGVEDKEAVV